MEEHSVAESCPRAQAVAAIRARMARLGVTLADADAVQFALAAATRAPTDLLDFLFAPALVRGVAPQHQAAITEKEFVALFGSAARAPRGGASKPSKPSSASAEFATPCKRLSRALKCTLAEREAAAVWARSQGRAVCHVALHLENPDQKLRLALGGMVHADSRRLEEISAGLDEEGSGVMLLARVVIALARSVV